jgi:Ecdysteroid kinase-like family
MTTIPITSAEISAEWLNSVLDDDTRGGARVVDVDVTVIGEGVGFVGEVARLTLTYDAPSAHSITTMISKMPTANEGFKHVGLLLGLYEKEAGFYRDVAPEMDLRVPCCYYNHVEGGVHFMLLLEDLAPMRPGDQLASCTLEEAELALTTVAQLHAHWWGRDDLDRFDSWLPQPDSPYFDILKHAFLGAVDAFHENFGDLVTPEIHTLVDRVAADYQSMVDAGVGREPHTFIHGDFRLDNMMFGDGGADAFALVDFQLPFLANPLWDVVYFLGGNFDPEWRREHQDRLVEIYHAALVDNGVAEYSLEQCREDYRAAGLVLLGYLVTGAADVDLDTLNDRGRELTEKMFRRYGTAIADLGSADFLP